ncbi:MAG: hypothetical protein A2204_01725 [Elusimicrobia bacterium RIFOXYA1_FULL_47_7]|nr:MAG: hypothetical protein A2278_02805 [Elusimicrobia bacterium RIFOXYA12_FULL_49_49]OGS06768.1 MAG: hypothetical protein A2204_01725 [Elusimicrobia bacterium RIFOXYA1_FULL_47_7]OGS09523.1 MAG: hypothetical protein A2386_03525 [Elusimicrobia bacterium RIFOXYB1_FULL_48_9]OGS16411.1 MAG: hypothetical protein A2251_06260 [Elusimicrobia bacterium RIFOXYA2_FULL_47_53]OGS27212.1 MAG: hypothetical protein A2339_07920 [Elusimicrobia bacterium RIFOXYB12_FULL_50_12]OGS30412.1 MAG: hypothetical protein
MKRPVGIALLFVFIIAIAICFDVVLHAASPETAKNIKDLDNTNKDVKITAIGKLAVSKENDALNALINKLKSEKENRIKIKYIEALSVYGSSTAVQAITSMLNDPSPYVRQSAIVELGYFGYDESVSPAIGKVLENEADESVKLSAINTLKNQKNKTAVNALGKQIGKGNKRNIQEAAVNALGGMGTEEAKAELKKYEKDALMGKAVRDILNKKKK